MVPPELGTCDLNKENDERVSQNISKVLSPQAIVIMAAIFLLLLSFAVYWIAVRYRRQNMQKLHISTCAHGKWGMLLTGITVRQHATAFREPRSRSDSISDEEKSAC